MDELQDFLNRGLAAQEDVDRIIGSLNAGGQVGWWHTNTDGASLLPVETGMLWGDGPADSLDNAIHEIEHQFQSAWGRKPTKAELEAGLKFALGSYDDGEVIDGE